MENETKINGTDGLNLTVSGSLPIEEVALHAADDWYDTAKFRSDVRADLKSYYEGYRDAMRFCQGNDR